MESKPNINEIKSKIGFGIKIWLEFEKQSILGSGWASLLKKIDQNKEGSLTQAAKENNYSYKYAWNILKRIERRTGLSPVDTGKGGKGGGGWVKLNEFGKFLLTLFSDLKSEIDSIEKRLKESHKMNQ